MLTRRPRASARRRALRAPLAALALASVLALAACQDADTVAKEQTLARLIHDTRAHARKPPLTGHAGLVEVARRHAADMAARQRLFHSPNLAASAGAAVGNWTRLGENVGRARTVEDVHAQFMASPAHRANILGDFDLAGVGVARDPSGTYWVVEVFAKSAG